MRLLVMMKKKQNITRIKKQKLKKNLTSIRLLEMLMKKKVKN